MKQAYRLSSRGPFTADQIRSGDPYELSNGHPVIREPTGRAGAQKTAFGAEVIETDPAVEHAGVDAGFAFEGHTLRAPDVAVGAITDEAGWVKDQAPLLALEYAGNGQDEDELATKISELLAHGTQQIWVVRLIGPRRVEVHRPGQPVEIHWPGEVLVADGVLRNPVPVEALIDRDAAHAHTLRNLLQRQGYAGIAAIREEARSATLREALLRMLRSRGLQLAAGPQARIDACSDAEQLLIWIERAALAATADEIFQAS